MDPGLRRGDSGWMDIPLKENTNPKVIHGPRTSPIVLSSSPITRGTDEVPGEEAGRTVSIGRRRVC